MRRPTCFGRPYLLSYGSDDMALMPTVGPVSWRSHADAHHARMHVYRVRVFTSGRGTASNGTLLVRAG